MVQMAPCSISLMDESLNKSHLIEKDNIDRVKGPLSADINV